MNRFLNGILLLLLLPVICMAEGAVDLTADDAGQLLYDKVNKEVLVYQKKVPGNRLQCRLFRSEELRRAAPVNCITLNGNVSRIDSRIIALEFAYCHAQQDKHRFDAYSQIARKTNSEQTNNLLSFYLALKDFRHEFYKEILEYNKASQEVTEKNRKKPKQTIIFGANSGGCPFSSPFRTSSAPQQSSSKDAELDLLESTMKDALTDSEPSKRLQAMSKKGRDVFTLFCLYISYRTDALRLIGRIGSLELRKELREALEQQGKEILEQFNQMRGATRNRENSFRSACPGKYGSWDFAPPLNLPDMWKRTISCYKAFEKTQTLSPYSEFPEWGNAMLEVLQMIKCQAWEEQFDKALLEYQNHNSN